MTIFFDSSTLISMATTCSLGVLKKLQKDYKQDFAITTTVKAETIDKALTTIRFKLEGARLRQLLNEGALKLYPDNKFQSEISNMIDLINHTYIGWDHPITIVQPGEISALTLAIELGADAYAVDERTTRILIESPLDLKELLESKLHTRIDVNKDNLDYLKEKFKDLKIIRSTELAIAAFEKGYFGEKSPEVLEGALWAMKLNGCAISRDEIDSLLK